MDYLVDGIPDNVLRNQARIQQFRNKSDLLSAFNKISLKDEFKAKHENKTSAPKGSNSETTSKDKKSTKPSPSFCCFNCIKHGHAAAECQLPKRHAGACFKCFEMGHQSKDYKNKRIQPEGKNHFCTRAALSVSSRRAKYQLIECSHAISIHLQNTRYSTTAS